MAKEKKGDITFDTLSNLNLDLPDNAKAEEVAQEEIPVKKAKAAQIKTSFKLDRDVHLALKQYSLIQGKDMAVVAFEDIIKPFLEEKGYFPPRKG